MLLIVLVTYATLKNVLWNGFVNYDDNVYIYENESINDLSGSSLISFFTGNVGQHPPLTMVTLAIMHYFFGLEPMPYHALSLVLHLLNSVLVFILVFRLSKSNLASLVAGMLFGIHPLHVESVAWATELKDVLYAFFFLLAWISYLVYKSRERGISFYILALFFFILSCFSKGMAVVLPLVLLVSDYYQDNRLLRKDWLNKVPFFLIALTWGILTFITQSALGATSGSDAFGFAERLFVVCYGVCWYLIKAVLPLELSAFYPFPVERGGSLPLIIYLSPVLLAALAAGIYYSGRLRKILVAGFLLFLVNLVLVLQLIPVGMAITADRYFYLSSIGLFFILGMGAQSVLDINRKLRTVTLVLLVFAFTAFAVLSNRQVSIWESSITLWNQVLMEAKPYRGYALAYTNRADSRSDRGEFEKAMEDYDRALELNPEYVDALNNRGMIRGLQQQYQEAIRDFDEAIRIRPDFAKAYNNRGNARRFLGDADGALQDFTRAINIKPTYLDAYINRGILFYLTGDSLAACSDWKFVQRSGSRAADQLVKDYCK